ncbi:beta strand repeat-containing protein [Nostoc sp. KVJ3]|uniref:beta strand repeat-containing protein n=1 Tax=Nostoc sp. KVJ3 TaxID=457945 RepID=UPI0022387ECF|nr:DUF4114 domain-containing protein [Nostoc sp. KVJ3]
MADSLLNLSSLDGKNGFTLNGNVSDSAGNSVSSAGDVNGDGIADVIIGASGIGKSYVVFGSTSGFSTSLDLSSLDGSNGFAINGSASDSSGTSVSNAGDINGDGIADLIIGAPGAALGAGKSYVVFGSSSGLAANLDLSSLDGSNGFVINGINGRNSDGISDSSGTSVSNAGDINGDGIDDLIIGAPSALSNAGQSYVVFGSTNGFSPNFDLSSLNGSNGFAISGNGTDSSGNSVSSAGDVNGDGISDLIIGAQGTGKSYVVFGSTTAFSANFDLSSLNGSNGFVINGNASDFFGASVSNAGDVNGDGIDDLIIGAYNAASGAGQSYVVFGTTNGFDAINNLSDLGSNGFVINGINGTDVSGYSVSSAGDFNDDGIDDLIIGAPFALSGAGQSYLIYGSSNGFSASLDLSNLDPSQGFAINGINATDSSAISVSAAGDINNDGADDLLVGAPGASGGAGQSYVVFGTPKPKPQLQPQVIFNLSSLDGKNGFTLNGNVSDSVGNSVSSAGDVNGDGIADLIIGASGTGKSYVVFGSTSGFSTSLDLSSLDGSNGFAINGSASDSSGTSVSNAGDINGDGIADLIIGAPGAALGAGKSYVVFGSSSGLAANLDLSSLDGSNGFVINGINGRNSDGISDSSGTSVSNAGDINGDGIDDLIIGAPSALSNAGQSYVVFGSTNGFSPNFDLSSLNGSNGFAISGNGTDSSGNSVSSAGDVNGDGISDLIIGAQGTGKSYVVFGSTSGFDASLDLSSLNGSNGFAINGNATDLLGASVSSAGDVNGDKIDDLIIGAYNAASGAGSSYVVFGSTNGFNASLDLSSLDGSNGFAIKGINGTDVSGYSVSSAGDFNDDGIDDLIIGAPFAGSNAGQSYLVFGRKNGFGASLDLSNLDPSQGFAINGINANDVSGISVSGAGDINGDGADDLIIGASGASAGAGQSYILFGTPQTQPPEPPEPPQLINSANDVFNIKGGNDKVTLKVSITGSNSGLVNELGVYTVDDATGKIDGIAPGEAGYAGKALERGEVILSAIANQPNGFSNSSLDSLLEFSPDTDLRFYLVKNSTTENVLNNVTPITDVLFSNSSNQKITSLDNNAFSLAWKDSSGNSSNDFQNLVVKIQSTNDPLPLGTSLQGKPQKELIDLRDVKQQVTANFVVNREASFNDFVGFYKVADENGGIDTNGDGKGDILVGQAGYTQAALRQRVAGIDLTANNQGTASYTGTFEPGSIFAPFIIINGRPDAVLDNNPNNDPAVYFPYLGANSDKVDHIRLLGNNTFGFEDLAKGGDKDFNDVIVRVNLSVG